VPVQAPKALFPDENEAQRRNALKHTCPKGAFLGLCERGLVRDIPPGEYTRSVSSSEIAFAALQQLRADPSPIDEKAKLSKRVYGERTPNDEVEVVLSLWKHELIR
jgi:hypothetical protein